MSTQAVCIETKETRLTFGIAIIYGYNNLAIVKENWKYIAPFGKNGDQLFDLKSDIGEKDNVAAKFPEKLSELKSLLAAQTSKK